ncbi:MAG: hypothetical protein JST93_18425 [Acidobacteria bacterium]|nr:hypothetical protein [Acidobacteriota bacterium]
MILWLALSTLHAATPQLHYTFTVDGPRLNIELALRNLPPQINLNTPSSWGNATNLQNCIQNLRAIEGTLSPDTLQTKNGQARIAYTLVQDWTGPLNERTRHRPHLDTSHFEINTANALVHPAIDLAQHVDVSFTFRLPPSWSLATSFGATATPRPNHRQRFRGPWDAVSNAMFAAGDFRLSPLKIGKSTIVTAVRGRFPFTDTEFQSQVSKLLQFERDFFHDHEFPYFLVTLAAYGPGQSGSGGGGFTNAFNLHTGPESKLSAGILSLIAHETFHTWNPLKMGRQRGPSLTTSWFTEGFTRYYQDILLHQAGLISPQQYLDSLNARIREYHSAAYAADTPPGDLLPQRGNMLALWLDHQIRTQSNGQASLDHVMLSLFAERHHTPDLDKERILAAISRHLDPASFDSFRRQLDGATPVAAPNKARLDCSQRQFIPLQQFELGMDREALTTHHRVQTLKPGSAAANSGLQEGDEITGMSIYWNDTSKPIRLTTKTGRRVEYSSAGPILGQIPRYTCP